VEMLFDCAAVCGRIYRWRVLNRKVTVPQWQLEYK